MVAIPTLHAGPHLDSCLRALETQTFRNFEVIVINNGDGPVAPPADLSFSCRVLSPGKNVGFGAAVNLAARDTSASFIATLNDDTEPDPSWLAALVAELLEEPRVGMCASRIRLLNSGEMDSAGMLLCLDGSSKQRGHGGPASAFEHSEDVLFPSACAALYRREMVDDVGFFDEDFYLYCEDTDLGLRSRWAGWLCRYVPSATVGHHYSATLGPFSPSKARFVERNRLWVVAKNFPLFLLPVVVAVAMTRYFWQFLSRRGQRGATAGFFRSGGSLRQALFIVARAHAETLLALPRLFLRRMAIRRKRRIGTLEFVRLILRHRITARELVRS